MDFRLILLVCLCLVAKVHCAAFGEACTNNADCTGDNQRCSSAATKVCECVDNFAEEGNACKGSVPNGVCTGADASGCVSNTVCTNDKCACKPGYEVGNGLCLQIYDKACTADSDCTTGLDHSSCQGTTGSKKCVCVAKYSVDATSQLCTMIKINDPCADENDCMENAFCLTTCKCAGEFYASTDLTECKPVLGKVCTTDPDCNTAIPGSSCQDQTGGTKACKCMSATYVQEDVYCKIKEGQDCTGNTDGCVAHASCPSTGTKVCTCDTGYTSDANKQCAQNDKACTADADCTGGLDHSSYQGTTGSKTCACVAKYSLDATSQLCTMIKIGEACGGNDDCPDNAMCSSALCQCDGGFYKKADSTGCDPVLGKTCTQDTECQDVTGSSCQGADGSKTCTCMSTYVKENQLCKIKEGQDCTGNTDGCVEHASCPSTGNIVCTCDTGYTSDANKQCAQNAGITVKVSMMLMCVAALVALLH